MDRFFMFNKPHHTSRLEAAVGLDIVQDMSLTVVAIKLSCIRPCWVCEPLLCNHLVILKELFEESMAFRTEDSENTVLRINSIVLSEF